MFYFIFRVRISSIKTGFVFFDSDILLLSTFRYFPDILNIWLPSTGYERSQRNRFRIYRYSGLAWLKPHTVMPLNGYDAVLAGYRAAWTTGCVLPDWAVLSKVSARYRLSQDMPPVGAVRTFPDVFGASPDGNPVLNLYCIWRGLFIISEKCPQFLMQIEGGIFPEADSPWKARFLKLVA